MDLKEVVGRMWAGFVLRETERIWNSCEYGNDLDSSYATGMFFIICLAISWNLRNCFAMWSQNKRILIWVSFFLLFPWLSRTAVTAVTVLRFGRSGACNSGKNKRFFCSHLRPIQFSIHWATWYGTGGQSGRGIMFTTNHLVPRLRSGIIVYSSYTPSWRWQGHIYCFTRHYMWKLPDMVS